MNEQVISTRVWRKSSYSGGSGACIEVAGNPPGVVAVRDSKNPEGPELTFASVKWVRFTDRLKGNVEIQREQL